MHVDVAIGAIRERHFVLRGRAGRDMAFRTRDGDVLSVERVSGSRVLFHPK